MLAFHTLPASQQLGFHIGMPALLRKFNYRNITLTHSTEAENVGVLDDNDHPHYFPWLGFIDPDRLGSPSQPVWVKLEIAAYSLGDGYSDSWRPVPDGKYVLGCQVGRGVYGIVTDGVPRVV